MKKFNEIYALQVDDMKMAVRAVSKALNVDFQEDEWTKLGRYFFHKGDDYLEFIIHWNWNDNEDDWNVFRFKEYALLLQLIRLDEVQSKEAEDALKAMQDVPVSLLQRVLLDLGKGVSTEVFAIDVN